MDLIPFGTYSTGRGATEVILCNYFLFLHTFSVYEKFQKLYKNRIICAMPYSHKVAVCRYIAQEMNLKVDYRGYDESKCRKRKVFSYPATPGDTSGHFIGSLQTVKCPALFEPNEHGNKYIFKTIFLTSNPFYESAVFVLQRLNLQQHEIKPEAFTLSIMLQMLQKDRRRIREYKHLNPDDKKTFATKSDSTRKQIQRSELKERPKTPPLIFFNRAFIENSIISFVQMKQEQKREYLR